MEQQRHPATPATGSPRIERQLPPFAPPKNVRPSELPTPAGYRALNPDFSPPETPKVRRFNRKRVVIGVCIAAVLHVGLIVGWWLTPPLRLKAGYSADRWVPVLSVPPTPTAKAKTPPQRIAAPLLMIEPVFPAPLPAASPKGVSGRGNPG